MSEDIKEAMVTVLDNILSYSQYVQVLQLQENRIHARKVQNASRHVGSFTVFHTNTSNSAGHPCFSPRGFASMEHSALLNFGSAHPSQDQHYAIITGQRKLAPNETQWRMDNGR